MQIFGVDFTSAPRPAKPITCAVCQLDGDRLHVEAVERLTSLSAFESLLHQPGAWQAGLDFPFGQPAALIDHFEWGATWAAFVGSIAALDDIGAFERLLKSYRDAHPPGHKQPLRPVDVLARSVSPMMLYGVPVGRMFFRGAPLLLRAGVSVLPNHPRPDSRIVFEAYPALAARKWIGNSSYKADELRRQTAARQAARQRIVAGLRGAARQFYGVEVVFAESLAAALGEDGTGDQLDAVLCAVQAAWAAAQPGFGIPPGLDPREGWIIDPALI